jgi:hypothetical protein
MIYGEQVTASGRRRFGREWPEVGLVGQPNQEAVHELSAGRVPLLRRRRDAVPVTADAGDPPGAILFLPDHHEFGHPLEASRRQFAKAVFALLDRTIVLDRISAEERPHSIQMFVLPAIYARLGSQLIPMNERPLPRNRNMPSNDRNWVEPGSQACLRAATSGAEQ